MSHASCVINRPSQTLETRPYFWGVEAGLKGGRGASSPSLVDAHRRPIARQTLENSHAAINIKSVSKKPGGIHKKNERFLSYLN